MYIINYKLFAVYEKLTRPVLLLKTFVTGITTSFKEKKQNILTINYIKFIYRICTDNYKRKGNIAFLSLG